MIDWIKNLFIDNTFGATRSSVWEKVRRGHLKDQPECQVCGKVGKIISNEVHHIKPFWKYPESELDPHNLITLCRTHHFEWGHFFDWSSWNEDIALWVEFIKNKP